MKTIFIYKLSSSEGDIRYIGKTTNIKRRLSAHISEAKKAKGKRHVLNWISNLLSKGELPIITVIEVCNESNWQEREQYWIDYYRKIVPNLCNLADGGLGGSGVKNFSKEEINRRKSQMSNYFSKFNKEEKIHIWKLIQNNYSWKDIKLIYPNFSQQIFSGINNGRQWNDITGYPIKTKPTRRKGYKVNRGLYIIQHIVDGKKKVLYSSKNEQDVIDYLKKLGK